MVQENEFKWFIDQFAELEGKKLSEEIDVLKEDSYYAATTQTKRTFKKRISRYLMIHDLKQAIRYTFKSYKKLVISLGIVLMLIVSFQVEAVRNTFLNFVDQFEGVQISVKQSPESTQFHIGWDNFNILEEIPGGFVRGEININTKEIKINSVHTNDSYILFKQYDDHAGLNLDTDNADEVRRVNINGEKGIAMKKNDIQTVAWQMGDLSFVITAKSTELSLEQLIIMAEGTGL